MTLSAALIMVALAPLSFAATPLENARRAFCQDAVANLAPPTLPSSPQIAAAPGPDGSWPDIDYQSASRGAWPPARHADRMLHLALSAAVDSAERKSLLESLHRAFAFWIQHDYQCPNWWYNRIGVPRALGSCGVLMGGDLWPNEHNYLIHQLLPRSAIAMTGQNRVWLAQNTFLLAFLASDETLAKTAAETIWDSVRISTDEGIQADFSFQQHGAQQQFGNYGLAFAGEIVRWMKILDGTLWAIPPDRLDLFRNYLLQGENWTCWGGFMDVSCCGRQLMPNAQSDKAAALSRIMDRCAATDPTAANAYRRFVSRNQPAAANDLVGSRYFWRSDYASHRGSQLFATLKMSSLRVIGAECVNSENLSGYHLGDGVLCLYRSGREYDGIFPVWDWRHLPGTTTNQTPLPSFHRVLGSTDFVGGVTSGNFGVSALDYQRDGVTAHKAWFFSGDEVYCLGAEINDAQGELITDINQALLQGSVIGQRNHAASAPLPDGSYTDLAWLEHAGLRYTIFDSMNIRLATAPVLGNWATVFQNPATPKAPVTLPVFNLEILHGTKPHDGHYAWAASLAGHAPIGQPLANTPTLQAVQLDADTFGIVFWRAGSFSPPRGPALSVDLSCVVILDLRGPTVRIADPTQKASQVRLQLGGQTKILPLPSGQKAGSTVDASFAE